MSFILKMLGGSIGPYIAGAIGAAILALVLAVWLMSGHLSAAHKALASERVLFAQEHASFLTEKQKFDDSEKARSTDHGAAVTDATDTNKTCESRIAKARVTSAAIDTLLNKAPTNAPDPAEPELLTASELRAATGR